ncbi:MAG TPA: hypothetical protein VIH88_04065 [Candidatus Acidoferrales bacterium]
MKTIIAMLCLLALSGAVSAQSPDPSKWMCRNLADSGGFTYQGETIFGTQACRPISQAVAQAQSVTTSPTTVASAQVQPTPAQQSDAPVQQPAQSTPVVNRQSPRVFLQAASHGNTWNARRDQSMEMSKDFEKVCPGVRVTVNQQMADYTVLLNHIELGLFARDNQMQIADKNGDLLQTKEGGGIKGGVKKVCDLILADWAKQQ